MGRMGWVGGWGLRAKGASSLVVSALTYPGSTNSATVEFHGTDKMPPIRIVIADGEDNEDVVIKVRT